MFDNGFFYSCQLALFISNGAIRADDLSSLVRSRLDIGEYEPMLIPEQPGMPPEFPRLHINTVEGYRLTMSRSRIDFNFELPLGIEDAHIEGFKRKCADLGVILHEKGISLSRVGWVKSAFSPNDNSTSEMIAALAKFSSEDVSDFSLSVTIKSNLDDWKCNSLYNISNGFGPTGVAGVICVRDINNDPAHPVTIASSQISSLVSIFDECASMDSIVSFINKGEGAN